CAREGNFWTGYYPLHW
nr:immunoglobulin heavy chain junction region [Macaca mulatta]